MPIQINLSSVPSQVFEAIVRKSSPQSCKTKNPKWVSDAISNNVQLTLQNVLIQAGRHFSDRVNPATFVGAKGRQAATALAWTICGMVAPSVLSKRLVVEDPRDPDVKRLCSEIFGVGLGLEVLRKCGVIDARTLRKKSSRFDFEARRPKGKGLIRIEVKGTFNNVSGTAHRASIQKKIEAQGNARNYDGNIGIIAALWTVAMQGKFDIELSDPERTPRDHFEQTVRDMIRFYAFRFDEAVGNEDGVKSLLAIADDPGLFHKKELQSLDSLGSGNRWSRRFWRVQVDLRHNDRTQEFLGSFWETRKLPVPLAFPENGDQDEVAFMGVDAEILRLIRTRNFEALLDYGTDEDVLLKTRPTDDFEAIFQIDGYGIARGIVRGELPQQVDLVLP